MMQPESAGAQRFILAEKLLKMGKTWWAFKDGFAVQMRKRILTISARKQRAPAYDTSEVGGKLHMNSKFTLFNWGGAELLSLQGY